MVKATRDPNLWHVRDQRGILAKVRPRELPEWVRQAVRDSRQAYFYGEAAEGAVVFGARYIGDPGLMW